MADVNSVLEVEMGGHHRQIVGVMIHVVTVGDLRGASMAPAIMGNDAIPMSDEEKHLGVPIVRRQRPAVTEHDGLARAPILVEDFDAVIGLDSAHFHPSLLNDS